MPPINRSSVANWGFRPHQAASLPADVMRIQVKGYLSLRDVLMNDTFRQLPDERFTVRDLVRQLAMELGPELSQMLSSSGTGGSQERVVILVNGRHCSHLPAGLETELEDGDVVAIFPPVMGG